MPDPSIPQPDPNAAPPAAAGTPAPGGGALAPADAALIAQLGGLVGAAGGSSTSVYNMYTSNNIDPETAIFAGNIRLQGQNSEKYTNVGDLLKSFYSMSPTELARIQRLLFAGGFYGSTDLQDIRFGNPDEASFSAWAQAVSRVARIDRAGRKATIDDVLAEAAKAGGIDGTARGAGKNVVVSLSDPLALKGTIDQVAQATLGRKANVDEQKMFVSLMHQMERDAQTAAQNPLGQQGVDADVNPPPSIYGARGPEAGPIGQGTVGGGSRYAQDQAEKQADAKAKVLEAAAPALLADKNFMVKLAAGQIDPKDPAAQKVIEQLAKAGIKVDSAETLGAAVQKVLGMGAGAGTAGAGGAGGTGRVGGILGAAMSAVSGPPNVTSAQLNAANAGTTTEVIQPSAQAQAEEQLRAANPGEAGAHDIASQFATFLQVLRGI